MARITRQEMKRDELVTTLARLTAAAEKHARSIGIAIVAIIVLAAAVTGGVLYSRSRERAAQEILGEIQAAAVAPVFPGYEDGSGVYPTEQAKFDEVLRLSGVLQESFPSTHAARWSAYWEAFGQMELGRHQEALDALAAFDGPHERDFIYWSAQFLKARVQEATGDADAAAGTYLTIADAAPETFPAEMALINRARLLDGEGRSDEALEAYKRVARDYPDSPYAVSAASKMRDLGASPTDGL